MALRNRKRGKPRRVERLHAEGHQPWHRQLKSRRVLSQLSILVGAYVGLLLVTQWPRPPLPYRKGDTAPRPIVATVPFDYVDEEVTQEVKALAGRRIANVYRPEVRQVIALRESLLDIVDKVSAAESLEALDPRAREAWQVDAATFAAVKEALGPEAKNRQPVGQTIQQAMSPLAKPLELPIFGVQNRDREVVRVRDINVLRESLPVGVPPEVLPLLEEPGESIAILLPEGDQALLARDVLTFTDSEPARIAIRTRIAALLAKPWRPVFGDEGARRLADLVADQIGPTLVFEQVETENRRADAKAAVKPIRIHRKAGATLVAAGTEITGKDYRILQREQTARREQLRWFSKAGEWIGAAAVIALVLLVQAVYTVRFQPQVARSAPRSLMLGILFLLVLGASKAVAQANWSAGEAAAFYTFFLTTAGMIVAIAYTQVFALILVWSLVLLVAFGTAGDFGWTLTALVGTAVAVLGLGKISNRSKLIKVGALAGLALFAAAGGLALRQLGGGADFWPGFRSAFWYLCSGLAAGFVMLGLLPFIERVFGIVTNISLLELCDVNQPALRRLAIEAPGTYTHSLLIGTLAEAAAEAIGANGLLARVGAYFHDIGKVNKPKYFVENWDEKGKTHEGLTPAMSRLVITSHVKDGLEMAERLSLPPLIKDFIAEHHGTTLVAYFYREAERQAESGGDVPSEEDYRYPGPKPRSAETAIVMLADAVEGASRSLKELTPARIKATVHEMTMERLLDGQLDESGLTLSNLHMIEQTLTKTLVSVYHGRVSYSSDRPQEKGPEAEGAGTQTRGRENRTQADRGADESDTRTAEPP